MNYQPDLIDTSKVTLRQEHLKVIELLAKNTHELWAQQRLADGWNYGSQRNDTRKEHPGLVPYEQLPESEKQYDRIISSEVLKTFLALGYKIEADPQASENIDSTEEQEISLFLQLLKDSSELNLGSLVALQRETIRLRPQTPNVYQVLGDHILKVGEPLIAYDVLAEGLKRWPNNARLQVLKNRFTSLFPFERNVTRMQAHPSHLRSLVL